MTPTVERARRADPAQMTSSRPPPDGVGGFGRPAPDGFEQDRQQDTEPRRVADDLSCRSETSALPEHAFCHQASATHQRRASTATYQKAVPSPLPSGGRGGARSTAPGKKPRRTAAMRTARKTIRSARSPHRRGKGGDAGGAEGMAATSAAMPAAAHDALPLDHVEDRRSLSGLGLPATRTSTSPTTNRRSIRSARPAWSWPSRSRWRVKF